MPPRLLVALFAVFACPALAAAQAPAGPAAKIDAVLNGPDYAHARWGILVVDAKTGTPVYERNVDTFATPASVTKLFTCAAAMIALGADSTTETPVYRRGTVSKAGVLDGDLILVGMGDLTFGGRTKAGGGVAFMNGDHTYANGGSFDAEVTDTDPLAALNDLAKQVKAAGVLDVTGEVLVDDRLFERTRSSGSGPDAVSPILVNDNVIDVLVKPGAKPGDPAAVTFRPDTAFMKADIDVTTGGKGTGSRITLAPVGPNHFTVRGNVAADAKPGVRIVPIDDPAGFARGLFIEALRRAGVRVNAAVQRPGAATLPDRADVAKLPKVAGFTSPPFRDAVTVTLKVSHNLYASTMPCLVAAKAGKRTAEEGLRENRKVLAKLGLDVAAISFGGGAGGSQADRATPRATVQLLQLMRKRPEWDAYKAGFPILGIDGTLATVVPETSPARGKAFAKTGTLSWSDSLNGRTLLTSKALAGVMTTASGTELVYAMFVNDVPLPPGVAAGREGKVLGKLCEILYADKP